MAGNTNFENGYSTYWNSEITHEPAVQQQNQGDESWFYIQDRNVTVTQQLDSALPDRGHLVLGPIHHIEVVPFAVALSVADW